MMRKKTGWIVVDSNDAPLTETLADRRRDAITKWMIRTGADPTEWQRLQRDRVLRVARIRITEQRTLH